MADISIELRSLLYGSEVCAWYVLVRFCYPALWSALGLVRFETTRGYERPLYRRAQRRISGHTQRSNSKSIGLSLHKVMMIPEDTGMTRCNAKLQYCGYLCTTALRQVGERQIHICSRVNRSESKVQ